MTVQWSQFFVHVQPHLPGCPEIVMREHLRDAAIDFCERSEVWRYEFGPVYTTAGLTTYELGAPRYSAVENIVYMFADDSKLVRVSDLQYHPSPNAESGCPTAFAVYQDTQVRLYPAPDAEYALAGVCVLKPTTSAPGVEDFLYEAHARTIACGALASLTAIPHKEWTNLEMAAYYKAKFHYATDDAKGRDTRRAGFRVSGARFA